MAITARDMLNTEPATVTVSDAIRRMLKEDRRTQAWLAEKMGYSAQSGVRSLLSRDNVNVNTLIFVCNLLGYEVSIQPKRSGGFRSPKQMILEGTRFGWSKKDRPGLSDDD